MPSRSIIENEPVFIIHQRPYSETSQILNLFSKNYGRVDVIAKGSKRPKSKFRSFIQPFMPLSASWSGRSQLKTLRNIEAVEHHQSLVHSDHFLSALYMNELILHFLSNADPYPGLFEIYHEALRQFNLSDEHEPLLRMFEIKLLEEIGYAINFQTEALSSKTININEYYRYEPEQGFHLLPSDSQIKKYSGGQIKSIQKMDFSESDTLLAAKKLTRETIHFHLDGKELMTKKMYKSIKRD
ncbi:MAG: DNA repair protein RecO [Gammaproteobacteria bacterium]|jgi:DNA repair protein RecO (recombination protein O)|nr:DNA repair protein RecO [Gammaproteobacteria bacterium]MBQ09161.1 DNA repair protein RecO [Gammaproteobacteria bacterium]MDP6146778.1 DNA repair protein RecO [Gammaproteobacteria bacterium]HJL80003.1 DNA repair protein RecO [Gammaproteobacteria bacterium]HJM09013.1 DNA repair protein RecO [Gammaproteobacteria bacterium]|tara:strand:- start:8219 stop:8941 length:723 start_codon:yes stop_codon:yes gene_type:complete